MKILIFGGTGLIGKHLLDSGQLGTCHWTIVTRNPGRYQNTEKIRYISPDDFFTSPSEWLSDTELIINLAGRSISSFPWTRKKKKEIFSSRVDFTRKLVNTLNSLSSPLPPLFNASAVGFYGIHQSMQTVYNEQSIPPDSSSFLQHIVRSWEEAAMEYQKNRVVLLRFGVVLSPYGGALAQFRKFFSLYFGVSPGKGTQPFAWIAGEEIPAVIAFLAQKDLEGPVNVVAPELLTFRQLLQILAKSMDRPLGLTIPSFLIKMLTGEFGREMILGGQAVEALRLKQEGYSFRFSSISDYLRTLTPIKS